MVMVIWSFFSSSEYLIGSRAKQGARDHSLHFPTVFCILFLRRASAVTKCWDLRKELEFRRQEEPAFVAGGSVCRLQSLRSSQPWFKVHVVQGSSRPSKWTRRVWVANCCWPLWRPSENPEKQTVGPVTASHKILTLQALLSSLNAGTAKRGGFSRGKDFGSPPAVCSPDRPRPFARYRAQSHGWCLASAHSLVPPSWQTPFNSSPSLCMCPMSSQCCIRQSSGKMEEVTRSNGLMLPSWLNIWYKVTPWNILICTALGNL